MPDASRIQWNIPLNGQDDVIEVIYNFQYILKFPTLQIFLVNNFQKFV